MLSTNRADTFRFLLQSKPLLLPRKTDSQILLPPLLPLHNNPDKWKVPPQPKYPPDGFQNTFPSPRSSLFPSLLLSLSTPNGNSRLPGVSGQKTKAAHSLHKKSIISAPARPSQVRRHRCNPSVLSRPFPGPSLSPAARSSYASGQNRQKHPIPHQIPLPSFGNSHPPLPYPYPAHS